MTKARVVAGQRESLHSVLKHLRLSWWLDGATVSPPECGFAPCTASQLGVLVAKDVVSPLAFSSGPVGPRANSLQPHSLGRATCARISLVLSSQEKAAGSALMAHFGRACAGSHPVTRTLSYHSFPAWLLMLLK